MANQPYLRYFGLKRAPFSIAPDPRFLYLGDRHREALANLVWGLNTDGGFVVLTGEVGTGKTTLSRSLLGRVPKNTDIAFVINPRLSARELLATVCEELGDPPVADDVSSKHLVDRINQLLLTAHANARRTVLVIDEAQNLSRDVLEQIRLLTNLETNERKLLQVVLIGQPELDVMLRRPDLRQLAQRITARYHLEPLQLTDLSECVRHRMKVAGALRCPFTPLGLFNLHRLSRGIPRVANVIADRALLGAYALERDRIGAGIVQRAAREISGTPAQRTSLPLATAAALLLLAAVGVAWLGLTDGELPTAAGWAEFRNPDEAAVEPMPSPAVALDAAAEADVVPEPAIASATPWPLPPDTATAEPEQSDVVAMLWDPDPEIGRQAFQGIIDRWFVPIEVESAEQICNQVGSVGLGCLELETTWEELRALDLPAVLHLEGDDGPDRLALVAMADRRVQLATDDGLRWQSLDDVTRRWTGAATVVWQLPPGYRQPLRSGNRGESVRWLRRQLAEAGHPSSGRADEFDASLERAVRDFQARNSLTVDGIAGPLTWIHLQRGTGVGIPSLTSDESG